MAAAQLEAWRELLRRDVMPGVADEDDTIIQNVCKYVSAPGKYPVPNEMQKWAASKISRMERNGRSYMHRGVLLRSCTGSGKTLGYLLPILCSLRPAPVVQVVIMANIAEVATSIHQLICYLVGDAKTSCMVAGGLFTKSADLDVIRNLRPRIVVGTGGRLMDLAQDHERPFKEAKILVLDEGQVMLMRGGERKDFQKSWNNQSKCIWQHLSSGTKQLVSATATSQLDTVDLMADLVGCPRSEVARMEETQDSVKIQLLSRTQYRVVFDTPEAKLEGLAALFMDPNSDLGRFLEPVSAFQARNNLKTRREAEQLREKCVIFCNRRTELDRLQEYLSLHTPFVTNPSLCAKVDAYGSYCFPHHCELNYATTRKTIYGDFEQGKTCAIMTAGSLALAIDVRNIGAIINYDVPFDADRMVHQCGRTGRGYASDIDATPIINLVVKGAENARLEALAKQLGVKLQDADPLQLPPKPTLTKTQPRRPVPDRSRSPHPPLRAASKEVPASHHRRKSRSRSRSRSKRKSRSRSRSRSKNRSG